MPGVKVYPNESFDEAYRRFKKQTDRNLVVTEVRARRFFEPMTEVRKKQKISARKKMLKRLYTLRSSLRGFADFKFADLREIYLKSLLNLQPA